MHFNKSLVKIISTVLIFNIPYWKEAVDIKNKNDKEVSLGLDQIHQLFFVILSKIKMYLLK